MAPVVTVRPALPPSLETILEIPHSPTHQLDGRATFVLDKSAPRMFRPDRPAATYTLFSAQQPPRRVGPVKSRWRLSAPSAGATPLDAPDDGLPPGGIRRPTRLSVASRAPLKASGCERAGPLAREWAPLQAHTRHRPKPDEVFAACPVEVLRLVLDKLRQLHLGVNSDSCTTCWLRDLCNICLSSHKWHGVARAVLYEDIQLVGPGSNALQKRFKQSPACRLILLRRTLRSNPDLARLVRFLKVPQFADPVGGATTKGNITLSQYEDVVATLVMACPHLEKLSGQLWSYDYSFKKVIHALSTRPRLTHMDWHLDAQAPTDRSRLQQQSNRRSTALSATLHPREAFLAHFRHWSNLKSLSVQCLPGGVLTPDSLLAEPLERLSCLKRLHLCNLPENSFNDDTLLSLPQLQELTLAHVTGLTSQGISAFATRSNSASLHALHLRHTPLNCLAALARILSNLRSLVTLSLAQTSPPVMPEVESFTLWMMPYLASSSLERLHWDITDHQSSVNMADDILVRSISAGGFPKLRALRTPNDPDGAFQMLCRPVERISLPGDTLGKDSNAGRPADTKAGGKLRKFPTAPSSTSAWATQSRASRPPTCSDLRIARLAAQRRLELSRQAPRFQVKVVDEDGSILDVFHMAGFMGAAASKIDYYLHPDPGASDENGGLVDMADLQKDAWEGLVGDRSCCTGAWNRADGVVASKKDKGRWQHAERQRRQARIGPG